jgi:hypothetical protein
LSAERFLDLGAQLAVKDGAQERRDVEGGEDSETIADSEECVGGQRDRTGWSTRSKESRKGLVFEEAQSNISSGRSCEFLGSMSNECGGFILHSRGTGIEDVGCEVGASVQHTYQCERFRKDEVVGSEKEGGKRAFEGFFEGCLAGSILHYCSMNCKIGFWGEGRNTNLSMIVMAGATTLAARKLEAQSEANLKPKFLVFHILASIWASATFGIGMMVLCDAFRFVIDGEMSISVVEVSRPRIWVGILPSLRIYQLTCCCFVADFAMTVQVNWYFNAEM